MFGAAEPRLRDLDPALVARAGRLRSVVDPERLHDLLAALPAPRVRLHRPEVMAAVDELVLDAFRTAGWRAELRQFDEPARWAWADADDPSRITPVKSLRGVNVVAVKPGSSLDSLVVVAHHDTVPGSGGADDNGSGVVALMELARLLAPVRLRRSVVLAAVDHEELGFFGSRRLVGELLAERRIVGAVVFEMLGYTCAARGSQMLPAGVGAVYRGQVRRLRAAGMRGDFLTVIYPQAARTLATCFAECLDQLAGDGTSVLVRAPADLPILGPVLAKAVPFARDFARSDQVSFWDAGVPAVQITDTANFRNPHYHRASDTAETLDYPRLADVIGAAALAVERTAQR